MNDIDRLRSRVRPKLELIADHFQVSARMQRISNDNIFAVEVVNPIDSHYIFLTRLNAVFTLNATASGKLVLYYMDATPARGLLPHLRSHQVYQAHLDHPG